ncbi:hypothetical protein OUZ56_029669 [Daphnia magna]|uniref:Uncharacterized protein n=2 Tax=Daphnia magna TaxID=35525 RepID=A0ABR0B7I2_9CRUS|nr:hypothetical protein OUZ56_029669 [Daphnia magna]
MSRVLLASFNLVFELEFYVLLGALKTESVAQRQTSKEIGERMVRTKKTVCSPSLTKSLKASNTKSNNDKDLTSSFNEAIDQAESASGTSASN